MNINPTLYRKHCRCDVVVDWRYRSRQHRKVTVESDPLLYVQLESVTHTPPALVCCQHGAWLKWLSVREAEQIDQLNAQREKG